jgi:hypothetical protein
VARKLSPVQLSSSRALGTKNFQQSGHLDFFTFSYYRRRPNLATPVSRACFESSLESVRIGGTAEDWQCSADPAQAKLERGSLESNLGAYAWVSLGEHTFKSLIASDEAFCHSQE